jgi:hypothetical protein
LRREGEKARGRETTREFLELFEEEKRPEMQDMSTMSESISSRQKEGKLN